MPTTVKTKTNQKRLQSALSLFHDRYSSPAQYGEGRWNQSLVPALLRPTSYVALVNAFVPRDKVYELLERTGVPGTETRNLELPGSLTLSGQNPGLDGSPAARLLCIERVTASRPPSESITTANDEETSLPLPPPARIACSDVSPTSLLSHWNLDAASVLAALLLDVQPQEHVLDLCSAPGGKTIALSQCLFQHLHAKTHVAADQSVFQTLLHCNEPDAQRNKRLAANLQAYLPPELFTSKAVEVLNIDGSLKNAVSLLPCGENGYDKVLVDAPCSSERHILHAHAKATKSGQIAEEMLNWKPSHSTALAKTQMGLLTNALLATRKGGKIVYATCALGKEENDGVVENVLANIKQERKKQKASGQPKSKRYDFDLEFEMGHQGVGLDSNVSLLNDVTEPTQYGRIALPDRGGWGPLYFTLIKKVERKKHSQPRTKLQDELQVDGRNKG